MEYLKQMMQMRFQRSGIAGHAPAPAGTSARKTWFGSDQNGDTREVYPTLETAATSSSALTACASCLTTMRAEEKCTFTLLTPLSRPTLFSILSTQDGQENPSARKVVLVNVLFMAFSSMISVL